MDVLGRSHGRAFNRYRIGRSLLVSTLEPYVQLEEGVGILHEE